MFQIIVKEAELLYKPLSTHYAQKPLHVCATMHVSGALIEPPLRPFSVLDLRIDPANSAPNAVNKMVVASFCPSHEADVRYLPDSVDF